ncbi:uncharacterized protein B0H18DRAFT_321942 [Fomitopsis serialis]|uniref:uncharacterized protein n=1 Tax=Fomitopsis serialis TaxID=139415 RepID=UPI0020089A89|nr:uncharacterized protein B0H18DRAFT_321942 [Neoantrodia serialis]KAH9936388.1 hypothetical protein B0H18DRAFT_321942 [Neoantrodia serialis]
MSAYFTRPRQPTVSSPAGSTVLRPAHHDAHDQRLPSLDIDFGESIYIFPNPSSVPPSPGSSLFSAPSDLPSSLSSPASYIESRRRPRGRHHTSSFSAQTSTSRSRSESASTSTSYLRVHHPLSPTTPTDTDADADADAYLDGDIEVELWEWTGESARSGEGSEPDSWVLEEEVQRASRWGLTDADTHVRGRPYPLRASTSTAHARITLDNARHRLSLASLRSRTRSKSSSDFRPGSAQAPQPRIRIPLLSFFAALLSLDLDDPALRLLTQPAPPDGQSILFPGHPTSSLSPPEPSSPSSDSSDTRCHNSDRSELTPDLPSSTHGLQRLFSSTTEPASAALRSLRAGLVAIPIDIDVPGVAGLAGLFRAVGEAYTRGGQAWKEIWAGDVLMS